MISTRRGSVRAGRAGPACHRATPTDTAEPGTGFVGETADNEPVVGYTAGPLPENPLPPEALASAAVAAPGTGAVAEAPKQPAP